MSILKLILFSEWDILPQLFILNTLQQNTPASKQKKNLAPKRCPFSSMGPLLIQVYPSS
jgi:hypothetical protein